MPSRDEVQDFLLEWGELCQSLFGDNLLGSLILSSVGNKLSVGWGVAFTGDERLLRCLSQRTGPSRERIPLLVAAFDRGFPEDSLPILPVLDEQSFLFPIVEKRHHSILHLLVQVFSLAPELHSQKPAPQLVAELIPFPLAHVPLRRRQNIAQTLRRRSQQV